MRRTRTTAPRCSGRSPAREPGPRIRADHGARIAFVAQVRPGNEPVKRPRPPKLALAREYHDALLLAVTLGPRREVGLHVRLDPLWNGGDAGTGHLHFSAIQNWDAVAPFFAPVAGGCPLPGGVALDTVLGVTQPGAGVIVLEFDHAGAVALHGAKVREG